MMSWVEKERNRRERRNRKLREMRPGVVHLPDIDPSLRTATLRSSGTRYKIDKNGTYRRIQELPPPKLIRPSVP